MTLAAGSTTYSVTGTNATGAGNTASATVTVVAPGTCVQSNVNEVIDWVTARGQNLNRAIPNGGSYSFQFKTPSYNWAANVIKEQSILGNPVMTFLHISPTQCDFTYPNYSAWDGCGTSGAVVSLNYIVEAVDSHTFGSCSLRPDTWYYVNIRNEDAGFDATAASRWSNGGPDTCAVGTSCGLLFQIH